MLAFLPPGFLGFFFHCFLEHGSFEKQTIKQMHPSDLGHAHFCFKSILNTNMLNWSTEQIQIEPGEDITTVLKPEATLCFTYTT